MTTLATTLKSRDIEDLALKCNVSSTVITQRFTPPFKNIESFTVDQLKTIIKFLRLLPSFSPAHVTLKTNCNKPELVDIIYKALQMPVTTVTSSSSTDGVAYRPHVAPQQQQQYNSVYTTPAPQQYPTYNLSNPSAHHSHPQYPQPTNYRPNGQYTHPHPQPVQPQYQHQRSNGYAIPPSAQSHHPHHTSLHTQHPPTPHIDIRTQADSAEFKHSGRSPYEHIDTQLCAQTLMHGSTTQMSFSFVPIHYQKLKRSNVRPPPSIPASQLTDVQLRLFDTVKRQHVHWDRCFRVRVNNAEVTIPEPKRLNKLKSKGLHIVKPLVINDYCGMYNNTVTVDYFRANYTVEPFVGIVVCELVTEKDTSELLTDIKQKAVASAGQTSAITTSSSPQPPAILPPSKRECAVCHKNDAGQLLRCSQCKAIWYCSAEHQRADWTAHRLVCKPATQPPAQAETTVTVKPEPGSTLRPKFDLTSKPEVRHGASPADEDVLDADDGIAATETSLSLRCPLSIDRINCAVKGRYCDHLTCFDLETYLMYSQQSSVWQCPLCYSPLPYDEIVIDPTMNAILKCTHEETEKIKVLPDGDWVEINTMLNEPPQSKKRKVESSTTAAAQPAATGDQTVNFLNDYLGDTASNGHVQTNSDSESFVLPPHSYNPSPQPYSTVAPAKPAQQPAATASSHFDKGGSLDDAIEID